MSPEERWNKWGFTALDDPIKEGSVEKVAALLEAGERNRTTSPTLDALAAMALGLTEQDKASLSDEARAAFDAVRLAAAPFFPRSCFLLVCSSSFVHPSPRTRHVHSSPFAYFRTYLPPLSPVDGSGSTKPRVSSAPSTSTGGGYPGPWFR